MEDKLRLNNEEIKKAIKEFGFERTISYGKDYFTHNMPEFLRIAQAQLDKALKARLDRPELREEVKIIVASVYNVAKHSNSRKACDEPFVHKITLEWATGEILTLISDIKEAKREEREKVIKYLKVRWCSYAQNIHMGISRHTFALPKDWEQALKSG